LSVIFVLDAVLSCALACLAHPGNLIIPEKSRSLVQATDCQILSIGIGHHITAKWIPAGVQ